MLLRYHWSGVTYVTRNGYRNLKDYYGMWREAIIIRATDNLNDVLRIIGVRRSKNRQALLLWSVHTGSEKQQLADSHLQGQTLTNYFQHGPPLFVQNKRQSDRDHTNSG
jgi:hypothetical protein